LDLCSLQGRFCRFVLCLFHSFGSRILIENSSVNDGQLFESLLGPTSYSAYHSITEADLHCALTCVASGNVGHSNSGSDSSGTLD
jgi:hypothetical protein